MLFAQVGPRPGGGPFGGGGAEDAWLGGAFLIFLLVAVAIGLVIAIMFYLTLSKCLSRVSPRNRRMEPAMVWLNLIPCFGMIWIFFTTSRIADSLHDEFADRHLPGDGDFGRSLGTTYPILSLLGCIPYLGAIFGLASLVCMIIYWVKIAGYSAQLAAEGPGSFSDRDYDRPPDDQWDVSDFDRDKRGDAP
jgi:hypothetical protein